MHLNESRLSHGLRDSGRVLLFPHNNPFLLIDTCLVCSGNDLMVRVGIHVLATIAHAIAASLTVSKKKNIKQNRQPAMESRNATQYKSARGRGQAGEELPGGVGLSVVCKNCEF